MTKTLPQKLYVQYKPDRESLQKLTALQQDMNSILTTGRKVKESELHVTVLHFGFMKEVYKQLCAITQSLDYGDYYKTTENFVNTVNPKLPKTCTLKIQGSSCFGQNKSVFVVCLEADFALAQAYDISMSGIRDFATELGIHKLGDITSQPKALQIPLELTPHISLFKGIDCSINIDDVLHDYLGQSLTFELDSIL